MSESKLVDALSNLAKGDGRPEMSKLRDIFQQIESTLSAGVTRADVLEVLHDQGFRMKLRSFESALYRLRKEQKNTPMKANKTIRIAGVDVASPSRFIHNPTPQNDLLK